MTQPTGADQTTFNNELRGALFHNDKGDNPMRPDYRGRCQIDSKNYRISGWIRTSRAGQKFLSLSFTADPGTPDAQGQPTGPPTTQADDADIPF